MADPTLTVVPSPAPKPSFVATIKADLLRVERVLQVGSAAVGAVLTTTPNVPTVQRIGGFVLLGIAAASAGVEAVISRL